MNRQNAPHNSLHLYKGGMTIEQHIATLEQTVAHQAQELASLHSQVAFLSQIVADVHETCNVLVKKAVASAPVERRDEEVAPSAGPSAVPVAPPVKRPTTQPPKRRSAGI